MVGDPLLVLVTVKGYGATAVIVKAESFSNPSGQKDLAELSQQLFSTSGSQASGTIFLLFLGAGNMLVNKPGSGPRISFNCLQAIPLNPDVAHVNTAAEGAVPSWSTSFRFPLSETAEAANVLWSTFAASSNGKLVEITDGLSLPYMITRDSALGPQPAFQLVGVAEELATAASADAAKNNRRLVDCGVPGCKMQFEARYARQHAAWHILAPNASVSALRFPCLLCASHEQQQYTPDLAGATGCVARLELKKGGVVTPITHCKVVGEVPYFQGHAIKSSSTQPSTNHLINCPTCPQKPMPFCVASYNMHKHWASSSHADVPMPPELVKEIAISDQERKAVIELGNKSAATRKRKDKEAAAAEGAQAARRARTEEAKAVEESARLGRGQRGAAARAATAAEAGQAAAAASSAAGEVCSPCSDNE